MERALIGLAVVAALMAWSVGDPGAPEVPAANGTTAKAASRRVEARRAEAPSESWRAWIEEASRLGMEDDDELELLAARGNALARSHPEAFAVLLANEVREIESRSIFSTFLLIHIALTLEAPPWSALEALLVAPAKIQRAEEPFPPTLLSQSQLLVHLQRRLERGQSLPPMGWTMRLESLALFHPDLAVARESVRVLRRLGADIAALEERLAASRPVWERRRLADVLEDA